MYCVSLKNSRGITRQSVLFHLTVYHAHLENIVRVLGNPRSKGRHLRHEAYQECSVNHSLIISPTKSFFSVRVCNVVYDCI